jgi:hypothetical protein
MVYRAMGERCYPTDIYQEHRAGVLRSGISILPMTASGQWPPARRSRHRFRSPDGREAGARDVRFLSPTPPVLYFW